MNYGMLWQAVSGFSFRLVGGEAAEPYPTARGANLADPVPPVDLQHVFRAGYWGLLHLAPKLIPKNEARVHVFLTRWHVGTIVFYPIGVHPGFVIHYLTVVLGRGPVKVGGVDVWYHADRRGPARSHRTGAPFRSAIRVRDLSNAAGRGQYSSGTVGDVPSESCSAD